MPTTRWAQRKARFSQSMRKADMGGCGRLLAQPSPRREPGSIALPPQFLNRIQIRALALWIPAFAGMTGEWVDDEERLRAPAKTAIVGAPDHVLARPTANY